VASCNSSSAAWIGYVPGGAMMQPKPSRNVSRSSRVIARRAGTVSSSVLSRLRSTRRAASSGGSASMAPSSSSTPSSTRAMASTAVIGLVSDAIRKMASRGIGVRSPNALVPITSTWARPPRATRATSPGMLPARHAPS